MITIDQVSSSPYQAGLSTYNLLHTVGSDVYYPALIVGVSIFVSGSVSSITRNGKNFVFVRSDISGVYRSEIWQLLNPDLGAFNITPTLSGSLTSILSAGSYGFCGGVGSSHGATGTGGTVADTITPRRNNSIVFTNLAAQTASGTSDAGGQNARINTAGALGTCRMSDKGPVNPAAATTLTYNGVSALDLWAISMAELLDLTPNPRPILRA